jgi:LL-diaminopimelate aminotransferase
VDNEKRKLVSQRIQNLPQNFFAQLENRITAEQASGCNVIRLDIGSPDMPPDASILQALIHSANLPDHHGYQPHAGPASLRAAWAELYRREFGVELDTRQEIVPLLGSKEGIFNLIMACIDPGDSVLVPDPGYMTYTRGTLFAGGEPVEMPLLEERSFLPDLSAIPPDTAQRAKMLWLNYPNNPTGATASLDFFTEAVEFARRYDLLLCHDAAYSLVTFDGYRAVSLMQVPGARDVAVEFNSLSKSHNMAGWRVGAAVGNRQALGALFRIKTNLDSSHFLPVLDAAIEAMTGDQGWLMARNEVYRQRRDLVLKTLHSMGLTVSTPTASIYVWSRVPVGWTSLDFVTAALEQAHVSLTPGVVFGPHGEGYMRISLTVATEKISEAMQRLAEWSKL